ncbi:unnamed protein product [Rhizopus microsporus]
MQSLIKSLENKDHVERILKEQPDLDINTKDTHGDTILHYASRMHNLPVIDLLVQYGADIEAVNEHGRRPIHEAIDSEDCIAYFIDHKVDVNAMKRGDWTPLMIAASKGNRKVVEMLVKAGALLNRTTKDGRTALYLAVQEGHIDMAKYLADIYPEAIAQPTKSGRLPVQAAASLMHETAAYEITSHLLSLAPSSVLTHRDHSGRNLLLDAAVSQNLKILKYLLDQGADPNDRDALGRSIIHHAAMVGHLNVLRLLESVPNVQWDAPDSWDSWTALMHAARQGYLDIICYLVETIRVDKDHKDKHGRDAQEISVLWGHKDVASYLCGVSM